MHYFAIIRFLTEAEAKQVFCHATTFWKPPHQGLTAITQVVLTNGAVAQHWMSFEMPEPNLPDSNHRYFVVGGKGLLDIDGYGKLMLGVGICEKRSGSSRLLTAGLSHWSDHD